VISVVAGGGKREVGNAGKNSNSKHSAQYAIVSISIENSTILGPA